MSRRIQLPALGAPCPNCKSPYEPHSSGVSRCTICMRFSNISTNSGIERRDGTSPGLAMTLPQFAAWFMSSLRACGYCGIPEELIGDLDLRTNIGLPLTRLGFDRLDNKLPYSTANIVFCCLACNATKSNTFNGHEMVSLGAVLQGIWIERLAAKGISWSPERDRGSFPSPRSLLRRPYRIVKR
jgi:hypothetical protein